MRNIFIILDFVPLIILFSCTGDTEPDQPNILFILADDQCYNTIHELA